MAEITFGPFETGTSGSSTINVPTPIDLLLVSPKTFARFKPRAWRKPDATSIGTGSKYGTTMKSPVVKRSIVIAGHKTSVSLEDAFWKGLKEIANGRELTLSDLVARIGTDGRQGHLSSAIRLFVLDYYRVHGEERIPESEPREMQSSRVVHSILRAD